ncbi:MAG TPA: hypothetical protein VGI60_14570 [Chthoniobacterales bacterium]
MSDDRQDQVLALAGIAWSLLFVGARIGLVVAMARVGTVVGGMFAVSEALSLAFTVRGLWRGVLCGGPLSFLVPVFYVMPLCLRPVAGHVVPVLAGCLLALACVGQVALRLYLWHFVSVGVPVYQGVVSSGPYRFVKHPLAACELVIVASFVCCYPTWWNVGVGCLAIAAGVCAALFEEAFLRCFSDYRSYSDQVPDRFFYGII